MQYAKAFTDALQFMWGEGFPSPGGHEEVDDMLAGYSIAGKRVLDIGSGLGGVDVCIVTKHGASEVIGIDVEDQLIEAFRTFVADRGLSEQVKFMLVDPGLLLFPDDSFDMVFTKDAMVHIPDKAVLYAEVLRVLKPGSHFIAADWLWAAGAASSAVVQAWLSKGPLKFIFTTLAEAEATLRQAGFRDVSVADRRHLLRRTQCPQLLTRPSASLSSLPLQLKLDHAISMRCGSGSTHVTTICLQTSCKKQVGCKRGRAYELSSPEVNLEFSDSC